MEQKTLAGWLKLIVIIIGLCGLVVFAVVIPGCGTSMIEQYPEFAGWYWPWLIFLWITGVPCYIALVFGWKVALNIGADHSFSVENARLLKWVSWLAAGDTVFFFAGNVLLLLLNMNHPGVLLASLLIAFVGLCVAVAAACLSRLIRKAADLQDQSDLTI